MSKNKSKGSILTNGILKENPVLVLLLGTCPTLAITNAAFNGLGMGLATLFVLVCSNFIISLLKNIIPSRVRIPSFIVIIAGFVTVVHMFIQAFSPALNDALGIYLPLIAVNCIVLGRAEMFASKNKVFDSVLDGIGMGIGFTLALFVIGSIRELLGSGTWFSIELTNKLFSPIGFFTTPSGGFFVFGIVVALVNKITKGKIVKKSINCESCPSNSVCNENEKEKGV